MDALDVRQILNSNAYMHFTFYDAPDPFPNHLGVPPERLDFQFYLFMAVKISFQVQVFEQVLAKLLRLFQRVRRMF